jgi:ligand-binding sensor domain-containing protein
MIWYYEGEQKKLFVYSPVTREAQPYYGIPNFERIGSPADLFFDRDGRLWVDNKGWLDFTGMGKPTWYEIIPSTAFLTDQGAFKTDDVEGPLNRYGFSRPIYIFQSSNGWMWFTTLNGIIRLDFEKEEWCLFTNGSSLVAEDNNGYIWISVFDKLYKYHLGP